MKDKFILLSNFVAKYAFYIFVILYSIANILFTIRRYNGLDQSYEINYLFGFNLFNVFCLIFIFAIFIYLYNKKFFKYSSKKYLFLFLSISFLMGIIWIFANPQELVELDDSYNCFRAASYMAKGDLSVIGYKSYINTYPHNLPLVTYFLFIIKIFGQSNAILVIRIINLFLVLLGYYSLYKITEELFEDEKVNYFVVLLMFLSMQLVFYSFMVYSNVIAYSTGMFSLWFFQRYIKNSHLKDLIISLIAIVVSASLKNNSLILFVAELIYIFLKMVKKFDYHVILVVFASLILFTITSTGIVKFWEKRGGNNYDNKLPMSCWIAYGINYYEGNPGGYTNELEAFHHENDYVVEYTDAKAKEFIDNALETFKEKPNVMIKFYIQKFLVSFANPEYDTFASYREIERNDFTESVISGKINDLLFNTWDATSTIVSVGLLAFIFKNNNKIKLKHLLLGVCILGGFLFHSFWETKSLYLYQYYLLLLPYAAKGLADLIERKVR